MKKIKCLLDNIINYEEKFMVEQVFKFSTGNLLKIPKGIKMNVKNLDEDTLELIVVKSPAPSNM